MEFKRWLQETDLDSEPRYVDPYTRGQQARERFNNWWANRRQWWNDAGGAQGIADTAARAINPVGWGTQMGNAVLNAGTKAIDNALGSLGGAPGTAGSLAPKPIRRIDPNYKNQNEPWWQQSYGQGEQPDQAEIDQRNDAALQQSIQAGHYVEVPITIPNTGNATQMTTAAWDALLQQAQRTHAFMVPHLQAARTRGCTPDKFYMPGRGPNGGQFVFLMPTHPNFLQC